MKMFKFGALKKFLFYFLIIIILIAGGFALSLKDKYVAPILMYHSVNPKVNPDMRALIVSPETFAKQMNFLKMYKYNVVPLTELARMIKDKKSIPPKTLAITFDDGFKDNYTQAYRILEKYRFPVTIFIIINEVGRQDRLSWEEIKEMQASGLVTFGSHALGPDPLIKIKTVEELKKQIADSKKILEDKLGGRVEAFSYPEGMFNQDIKQLVIDSGYLCAVATNPGSGFSSDDIFLLKRLRISENCRNSFIFGFEISGYYTYFKENKKKGRKKR